MSGESAKAGMSSLVMQAAKRAAQADGVVSSAAASAVTSASKAAVAVGSSSGMSKASACALQQARSAIANTNPSAAQQQQGQAPQAQAQPQQQQPPPTKKSTKGPPLRRGKWTPEEEAYANRLIQEFKAGLLPLTDGTTLRTFLSKLLNCDPMRISKKFVGSNCIGKQVFRRRNADLNRLTPEQIQQSRAELSELERRFLERVAQTNRVKTSVGGGGAAAAAAGAAAAAAAMKKDEEAALAEQHHHHHQQQHQQQPPSPPWLQPPLGYKHGMGASMAAGPNSRAAAAGRALLEGAASSSMRDALERTASRSGLAAGLHHASRGATTGSRSSISSSTTDAATNLLVAELQKQQQRASQQNLLNALNSSNNLFAVSRSGSASALSGLSSNALSQLARKASVSGLASNPSISNLMLKTGLSRDQLSQLARERGLSSTGSIPNMMQRQSSFDALMSLDFQSLQSIDNLANLMQTGSVRSSQLPETGLKNADFGSSSSRQNLAAAAAAAASSSSDLSTAARRLASAGRLESLLQSISSNNVRDVPAGVVFATAPVATGSNANLNNLLQSMQGNASAANLLGAANGQSAVSLADLLRQDSSTGLTALRFQDGLLNQRNSSVDDFLSLVAAGDIPLEHQDPSLLNIPLMQQQLGGSASQQQQDAAEQLLQQASGNSSLVNALASRSLSNLQQASAGGTGSSGHLSASALAMAQARQHRLAGSKRSLEDLAGELNGQGNVKKRS